MILLIDNYDSFTWNLVQALRMLSSEVDVRRNDAIDLDTIRALRPRAIVISPGPGRPEQSGITPLVPRGIEGVPILGVCLGHQAIGLAYGARLVRAPRPVHGMMSVIHHSDDGLFAGVDQPLEVGRYHSLVLERESLPSELRVTAETDDGLVMALEHTHRPLWGVQFHPESILTPNGNQVLARFLELAGG